jgi:LPXTG-motif cell wall-anchored protein
VWQYLLIERWGPMSSRRMILWTVAMAYCGFLIAGRGARSFDSNTIWEALIGAVLGLLLAILFTRRARRKHV